jgi:AcrR family transcriptional regulator
MRYSPEHKQVNRQRFLEAGAALAKREGFGNTGMDALMAEAGLTTGAFYTQFRSKTEFLHAIIEHELGKTVAAFEGKSLPELQQALAFYLSPWHARHPAQGCPVPALGAEVARADMATRSAFEERLLQLHALFAAALGGNRQKAWALVSQAIGAVLLARAMATPAVQEEVLASVLAEASAALNP